jgi:hypothetical protein
MNFIQPKISSNLVFHYILIIQLKDHVFKMIKLCISKTSLYNSIQKKSLGYQKRQSKLAGWKKIHWRISWILILWSYLTNCQFDCRWRLVCLNESMRIFGLKYYKQPVTSITKRLRIYNDKRWNSIQFLHFWGRKIDNSFIFQQYPIDYKNKHKT